MEIVIVGKNHLIIGAYLGQVMPPKSKVAGCLLPMVLLSQFGQAVPHSATNSILDTRLEGKTDFSKAKGTVKFKNEDGKIIYQTTVEDIIKRHDEIEKSLNWKF